MRITYEPKGFCSDAELRMAMKEFGSRIIAHLWRTKGKGLDPEEWRQEAMLNLAHILVAYDRDRCDVKLETHVYECLMNRIKMMQRERFAKYRIPRDKQTSYDIWFEKAASAESELQDLDERDIFEEKTVDARKPVHSFFMENLDNHLDRDIQRKQLKQAIQKANLSERQITVLKYSAAGYPQTQIGKKNWTLSGPCQ